MSKREKIFQWSGKSIDDYSLLISKVESTVNFLSKGQKKKLLICLIELLQNVFIHNKNESANITIIKTDILTLEVSNNVGIAQANYLETIFKSLLKYNKAELKEMYANNLKSETTSNSAGNGIILCLLKSNKKMNLLINNVNNTKKQIKFKIIFEKMQ